MMHCPRWCAFPILLLTAGASAAPPACPGSPLAGKCLYGTALQKIAAADAAACCAACIALAGCQGWQFGDSCKYCTPATPCVLKNAIPSAYNDNCTSGYPGGVPPAPPTPLPAPTPAPDRGFAFNTIFTGGAVLQHGAPVEVWGSGAAPGTSVALRIGDARPARTVADDSGRWSATLPAQAVSWNVTLTAAAGAANATSVIVSFGLVVLCSGQR